MKKTYASLLAVCAVLIALGGCFIGQAQAASQKQMKKYSDILAYVKKNKPASLSLKDVELSPVQLLNIRRAMPQDGKLSFTTAWQGCTFSHNSISIDLRKIKRFPTVPNIEAIIQLCPQCKTIDISGEHAPGMKTMQALQRKYKKISFGYKVRIGKTCYYLSNLATAYSTFRRNQKDTVTEADMESLRYCKELKALDVGHNQIKNLEFLPKYAPGLELLILADNPISDITPIGKLTHLQYLELFSTNVTDISPLANCMELIDLHLDYLEITNLRALDNLKKLERLWILHCKKLPKAEVERFKRLHPDCQVNYPGTKGLQKWREHSRYFHYYWCLKHNRWIPFDQSIPGMKSSLFHYGIRPDRSYMHFARKEA